MASISFLTRAGVESFETPLMRLDLFVTMPRCNEQNAIGTDSQSSSAQRNRGQHRGQREQHKFLICLSGNKITLMISHESIDRLSQTANVTNENNTNDITIFVSFNRTTLP